MLTSFRQQLSRIRGSLERRKFDDEFDQEVEAHLSLLVERFLRRGLSPEDARYAARKQFGGITQMKNDLRDRGRLPVLEAVWQDSAYVARQLRKSPLFAVAAILTLALGIGANTAIFTLVDQLILRLLPIKDPQQVVALVGQGQHYGSNMGHNVLSYTMYQTFRDRNAVFSQMMCRRRVEFTAATHAQSEVLSGELVSGNYFPLLGVRASLGRVFTSTDDLHMGAHPLAVLSYAYWRSRFAGDPGVLGQTVRLNNYPLTIVGVSQPGFDGVEPGLPAQIFVPIAMTPPLFPNEDFTNMFDQRTRWVNAYGRLKPGVTPEKAKAGLQPLFHQILAMEVREPMLAHATPYAREQFLRMWLDMVPGSQGNTVLRRQFEKPLLVLMAVVGLVLLIACANLASLLAARAAARQKEIAVRLAMGSSRARIVQQLLTESLLLAVVGGAAGVGFAVLIVRGLLAFLPDSIGGFAISSSPDPRMLAISLGLSLLTGILFGLAPALQSTCPDIARILKDQAASVTGGAAQMSFRKTLVAAQVTLSLLLLIGASLFIRSLANLYSLDPGFRTQRLVQFQLSLDSIGYDLAHAHAFYRQLEQRLRSLPGVRSAGMANIAVLSGGEWENAITVAGHQAKPGEENWSFINVASPGYFETLGVRLLAGRAFRENDTATAPKIAIVNRSFARQYFGNETAVGHHIGRGDDPSTPTDIEIVGVVNDMHYQSLKEKIQRQVFLCAAQAYQFDTTVYVNVERDPKSAFSGIRKLVHEMEPNAPIMAMKTVAHQLDESLVTFRLQSRS